MRLIKDRRAVSPVVGVMLMLVVTIILAAVVSSFSGGLATDESKAPQIAISAEAKKDAYIIVHHEGGDPINLDRIDVKTFIPEGTYADMSYKVQSTSLTPVSGDRTIETGEAFKINWSDAFATSAWGLMAPNAGEKVVIEIYEKGGDKPIAKTTAIVRP